MKEILIVGPGGLGGAVAALLAAAGTSSIHILGRPGPHLEAVRKDGLRITGLKEVAVPVDVIDDPSPTGAYDVIIYATKAQDTAAALERTAKLGVREFVASIQNGVIKDDALAAAFGSDKVVGAIAMIAAERTEPGAISFTYDGGTYMGELTGGSSQRVDDYVALCRESGLFAEAVEDIVSASWSKMTGWIPVGLLATLTRCDNATILSNRLLVTEFVTMIRELNLLARARGVELRDVGPYFARTWCQGSLDEAVSHVMSSPLASSRSTHSALQDVTKGMTTEFNACVRPMIDEARRLGVRLPGTQLLFATLMGLEASLRTSAKGDQ